MDISFIILNYKSEQVLKRCVDSIAHLKNCEILIVNNDDKNLDASFFGKNKVTIINNCINVGFAKGGNIGAKISNGRLLFFLNADTELLSADLSEIIRAFEKNSDLGAVAPRLLTQEHIPQEWSAGFDITPWDIIKNNFGLIGSKKLWTVKCNTEADWVSGAAIIIPKDVFAACGGFDENFFMYFEDVDICRRIKKLGKKILIIPKVEFLHLGGKSYKNHEKQKQQYYLSQDYYMRKNFGFFASAAMKALRKVAFLFSL